jgi:hypothetical protein
MDQNPTVRIPGKVGRPKGIPKTGGGSRKNIPNVATKNAREAIALLVDANSERMQGWLDQIAEKDGPMAAWRCLADVIEYHIPKLARSEVKMTGEVTVRAAQMSDDQILELMQRDRNA